MRVTGFAVLVMMVTLFLGGFVMRSLLARSSIRAIRTDTQVRAAEVANLSLRNPLPNPLPSGFGDRPTLLQVIELDGTVSAASVELANQRPLLPNDQLDGDTGRRLTLPIGQTTRRTQSEWWVEAVPATVDGRRATVIVATSLVELNQTLRQLGALLTAGIPLLTAAAGMLVWFLVGQALNPVERLRFEVQTLARDSRRRDQRVGVPATDDEIAKLASTLNELLDQLERSATAQQRFVADASHELRGPVANIRLALEIAQAHPDRTDWVALTSEVLAQDERMGRLVEDLLLLARSESDLSLRRTESLDLADIITECARPTPPRLVPIKIVHNEPTVMIDDRSQLISIVSNLVENAGRFAQTQITVSSLRTAGWVEIVVRDDGPGVPLDDREHIFDRFYRVDAHRSREGGGSGLGLAIVARLVAERSGTVTVGDANPTGSPPGAVFTVRLPLPPGGMANEKIATKT